MKYKSIKEIKEILDLFNYFPNYIVDLDKEIRNSIYRSESPIKVPINDIHMYIGYYIYTYDYEFCIIG